jgi:GntR family transcriptional regulator/MocR family aminotransferase
MEGSSVAGGIIGLDPSRPEPLYRQLRAALEHRIATRTFSPDRPLPSSRDLARELGVSRNTVTSAYAELIAEGFAESRPRSGVWVNAEMQRELARELPRATAAARYDWPARLGDVPDTLPRIEKHPRWYEFPYPFVGGQIEVGAFPSRAWLRSLERALHHPHGFFSLGDSQSADDPLLVEMVCRHVLPSRGIEATPDQVLVTLGSQHGLNLVADALLGPGSRVGVEEPGYPDAWHVFAGAKAELVPLGVDSNGLVPHPVLREVDLLYLTPSHQYPTNVTLSAARRRHLLALAPRTGLLVVEDDYDSEFRYHGRPTPSLKALDGSDQIVYLGSVSKFLAPGLRLGWVVAATELIARLRERRRYTLRHPPGHAQRALALFLQCGDYARALRALRGQLRRKWELCAGAVERDLGWCEAPPTGGVSLWLTGPPQLDARRLAALCEERGALIEPGDTFFLRAPRPPNHVRLGFAAIPLSAIESGIRVIAEAAELACGAGHARIALTARRGKEGTR